MRCDCCHRKKPTKAAILPGKGFGHYCGGCIADNNRQANTRAAAWDRDRDYEDHKRDLLQPWDEQGNINSEFVREYPEESKELFSQEEIEKHAT